MRIALCTLCLNEMEWLPLLYEQHKDWPGLVSWTFVESADRVYAECNPDRVSSKGLSVDGTTEYLSSLARSDRRVRHVPYGFSGGKGRADQGKCESRQQYLVNRHGERPDVLVVLDADEFYARADQLAVNKVCDAFPLFRSYLFPQRHLWCPPSLQEGVRADGVSRPLSDRTKLEVVGGYWDVPHFRVWRWSPDVRYSSNHNYLEDRYGQYLTRNPFRFDRLRRLAKRFEKFDLTVPQCVHLGFASSLASRRAKHSYYRSRGEERDPSKRMYLECRAAFESWGEGDALPHGATVVPYAGPVPEVFRTTVGERGAVCPKA